MHASLQFMIEGCTTSAGRCCRWAELSDDLVIRIRDCLASISPGSRPGRGASQALRSVCSSWRMAVDRSTAQLRVTGTATFIPAAFPCVRTLDLSAVSELSVGDSVGALAGLRSMAMADDHQHQEIAFWATALTSLRVCQPPPRPSRPAAGSKGGGGAAPPSLSSSGQQHRHCAWGVLLQRIGGSLRHLDMTEVEAGQPFWSALRHCPMLEVLLLKGARWARGARSCTHTHWLDVHACCRVPSNGHRPLCASSHTPSAASNACCTHQRR